MDTDEYFAERRAQRLYRAIARAQFNEFANPEEALRLWKEYEAALNARGLHTMAQRVIARNNDLVGLEVGLDLLLTGYVSNTELLEIDDTIQVPFTIVRRLPKPQND